MILFALGENPGEFIERHYTRKRGATLEGLLQEINSRARKRGFLTIAEAKSLVTCMKALGIKRKKRGHRGRNRKPR